MKALSNLLVSLFEIPFDPYDENSNRDNVVSSLINMMSLVLFTYLIVTIIRDGFSKQILLYMFMLGILIVAQTMVRQGKTHIVSMYFVGIFWLLGSSLMLLFENGLRAPGYIAALIFIVVYTGLMHGQRAVIIITVLTILVNILVGVLEMQGYFLTEPKIPDIRFSIIAQVTFFPLIAFMVTRTLKNLNISINLFRDEVEKHRQSQQQVNQLNQELELAYETTLEGWARALELRDKETEGHSRRVTDFTIALAKELNFSEKEIRYVYYGALLHDIGKMGIPDEILNKPAKLTDREREIVNQHPLFAYNMLKDIVYLKPAISIPYSHHENWDGSGYPQGLLGEEIPLAARIFAVVDNWDALTSDRPYRSAWTKEKTISYIKEQSGIKFDPNIVDIFISKIVS